MFVTSRSFSNSGSHIHFATSRFANQLLLNFTTDKFSVDHGMKPRSSKHSTNITDIVAQKITDNQIGISVTTVNWNLSSTMTVLQLGELIRRLWEVEHVPETIIKSSKEQIECEEHFKKASMPIFSCHWTNLYLIHFVHTLFSAISMYMILSPKEIW